MESEARLHGLAGAFREGWAFPSPGPSKTAILPSAGFPQPPPTSENPGDIPVGGRAHIPTTLDYAVRVTEKQHSHFAFDIGIGQVAGNIGTAQLPAGLPAPKPLVILLPVNLEARHGHRSGAQSSSLTSARPV
jgi:hypothetical protein